MLEPTSPRWTSPSAAADSRQRESVKTALREILETLALTALIFALVSAALQTFKVEGRSMEPTLLDGQYLLINKGVYWRVDSTTLEQLIGLREPETGPGHGHYLFGSPQRGDVIVFRFPRDVSRPFIKRIIGLPGETVEIRNGNVLINGVELLETYEKDAPRYHVGPEMVPIGQYFVLGDNRNNSSDSHVWGMVPEENVMGKALLRYWPPNAWGLFLASPGQSAPGESAAASGEPGNAR